VLFYRICMGSNLYMIQDRVVLYSICICILPRINNGKPESVWISCINYYTFNTGHPDLYIRTIPNRNNANLYMYKMEYQKCEICMKNYLYKPQSVWFRTCIQKKSKSVYDRICMAKKRNLYETKSVWWNMSQMTKFCESLSQCYHFYSYGRTSKMSSDFFPECDPVHKNNIT